MKPRVWRALMRGGCIGRRANGVWSVWRSTDRRGAVIADMDRNEVEGFLLEGALKPLGGGDDAVLVWCGGVLAQPHVEVSAKALMSDAERQQRPQSLLLRIMTQIKDDAERQRLRQAALDFASDIERAQTNGAASGMNWQALAAGTRIDGGTVRGRDERLGRSIDAAARVALVMDRFERDAFRFLERMALQSHTRYALAKWRGMRPVDVEREGVQVLRKLARLYDLELKPVSRD